MQPPPPSYRRTGSLPPRPPSSSPGDLLAWTADAIDVLEKRLDAHEALDADVHARVDALIASVGADGSVLTRTKPTGIYKAVADGFDALRAENDAFRAQISAELTTVLQAVNALRADRDADRTSKLEAIKVEDAKREALAQVRAPWAGSWTVVRNALLVLLVGGAFTTLGALLARHFH